MPYFLFVVDIPSPGFSTQDPGAATKWFDFESFANSISLPEGAKKLPCKNVWLFPVEGSEQARRALANGADAQQLNHSTYLLSGDVTKI